MDSKALGQRIKKARQEKGYTGEQLAEKCAISANYLRQIESGAKSPSLAIFIDLCNALEVSTSNLLQDVCQTMEVSREFMIGQMLKVDDLQEKPMRRFALELVRFIWETAPPKNRNTALRTMMRLLEELASAPSDSSAT